MGATHDTRLKGLECAVHSNDAATNKPSGERKGVVIVTAFTAGSPNTISCKNLGSTSFTLVSGDWFVVIGNAQGEGTTSPTPWADELSVVWNQSQIFRTSLKLTRTLMKAVLRGETDELIRLRRQKGSEDKVQRERAMMFGSSKLGTNLTAADTFADGTRTDADGNILRTTMGVIEVILKYGATSGDDQNIFSIPGATYSFSNFVDDMEKVFRYNPAQNEGTKYMFLGAGLLSYWSKLEGQKGFAGQSGWTVNLSDMKRDTLGFNFKILETPHGLLKLVPTPSITFSPYKNYGAIIDADNVFHALYDSPQYRQNIKTDDAPDYQKDEYFSDEGVGITLLKAHKLFKLV
uniref:Putative structural protein n=1 Tax=viral metagenome TaxID=1070528 RepID=A0A6H1ZZF4_9ZZZZ